MEFCYIDESYDSEKFVLTAFIVPEHTWAECFETIKTYRQNLKKSDGIFTSKELHATDLVAGRGRISERVVPKFRRCEIFKETLRITADLPGVAIINGCWNRDYGNVHQVAFDRVLNRIQRRCAEDDEHAVLVIDEGREEELRKIARKMHVFNRIPSQFGAWEDGSTTKNIKVERILEDPIFKDSQLSYFLQIADLIAFALLKSESPPTAHVSKYALDKAFDLLRPVCVIRAHAADPRGLGIIRK